MKHLIVLAAFMFVAACSTSATSRIPEASEPMAAPDVASLDLPADADITPLDILEIKVYNVAQLDGAYQVEPNGELKMPLIGAVKADGLSVFELADQIEAKLQENFLQNPLVTIKILEAAGGTFSTEGAVRTPGVHPVRGKLTLMEAMSLSGGLVPDADPKAIVIFRNIDGQRKAARFDMNKIRAGESADPLVYDGDIILVDSRQPNPAYQEILRTIPIIGLFVGIF